MMLTLHYVRPLDGAPQPVITREHITRLAKEKLQMNIKTDKMRKLY